MSLFEINVWETRHGGGVVELRGELDLDSLHELSGAVGNATSRWSSVAVDLSGVTFADLLTLRELSDALILYPGLSLHAPSREILLGARACGLEKRLGFDAAGLAKAS